MQPQVILGITSNWGTLVAWAAVRGNFAEIGTILPIYIGSIFWTLVFDTTYAHQVRTFNMSFCKCPLAAFYLDLSPLKSIFSILL
jgi:4-hydroxybenzoate polyprenyltransferase